MLSSTVRDLLNDRRIALEALESTNLVRGLGVVPVKQASRGASSLLATLSLAEDCHLYVLLMGGRYGFVTERGKSATELEYDAAYRTDPTKVLVFVKSTKNIEAEQQQFIDRVSDYHKGYYTSTYRNSTELKAVVLDSFTQWLVNRAGVGVKLHYFDHFIRMAVQRSPFPGVHPTYAVTDTDLELKYKIMGRT
ncbi:DUF4062 domain-containing protein [Streptomyces levis]|uniref:DUF4062 domain-containing protein n=1 Tax=Streptomyces levis TaxID=285566 RepID=UPI003C7D90D4